MTSTANAYIQVDQGTGPKVSFVERSKASNTVDETEVAVSLPYVPTYRVGTSVPVSLATPSSHVFQLLGSTINRDLLRSIEITQIGNATASTAIAFQVLRVTTAGTGGTSLTPQPVDPVDPDTTATAMTLPTSKGAEGANLGTKTGVVLTTAATAGHERVVRFTFPETGDPSTKPPTIVAGGATGLVVKNIHSDATATVHIVAEFQEAFWQ